MTVAPVLPQLCGRRFLNLFQHIKIIVNLKQMIPLKRLSCDELKSTLTQCGLEKKDLGIMYLADRLNKEGDTISSALDHIYTSTDLKCKTTKLEDHLPIRPISTLNRNTARPCLSYRFTIFNTNLTFKTSMFSLV